MMPCATQYAAQRGIAVFRPLENLYATLVLECRTCHFSTDAFNSVLIAQPNLRGAAIPNRRDRVNANKNNKKRNNKTTTRSKQRGNAMSRKKLSRRQFVAATALSSAALITAPYVRGAYAAGKLSIGFWDHWVPGANNTSTDLVNEWAAKEKVEVSIDYISEPGQQVSSSRSQQKRQAKSGHDILAMPTWWPHAQADLLEPMNDVMEPLIKQNGEVNGTVKYLGKAGDKWLGVPASDRQPDQGSLLPHRSDEEARRHRRAGNVSGRQPAESRQLDHGHIPESGRSLPKGRRSLRDRTR